MQVHGSEQRDGDSPADGVQFVDLDALAEEDKGAQSDVA
jgi:hypothetical protein